MGKTNHRPRPERASPPIHPIGHVHRGLWFSCEGEPRARPRGIAGTSQTSCRCRAEGLCCRRQNGGGGRLERTRPWVRFPVQQGKWGEARAISGPHLRLFPIQLVSARRDLRSLVPAASSTSPAVSADSASRSGQSSSSSSSARGGRSTPCTRFARRSSRCSAGKAPL
jgi:hypothetical protein